MLHQMNLKQFSIFIAIIFISLFSELFPPWQYEYDFHYDTGYTIHGTCPAGYSFITHPPQARKYDEMEIICLVDSDGALGEIKVYKSMNRLNSQRVFLLLITSSLSLKWFSKSRKSILALSNIILGVTAVILALYILLLCFTNSLYFAK